MRIHLHGPLKGSYSLALVNRQFAIALAKVADLTVSSDGEPDLFEDDAFRSSGLRSLHMDAQQARRGRIDVFTQNTWPIPVPFQDVTARNAIHCFAWEETLIAASLAKRLSDFDLVATTSVSTAVALRNSGVTSRTVVCGNGTCHIPERLPAERRRNGSRRPYRFLHASSCFTRKGVMDLVAAYLAEFDATDAVELKIKTFHNMHNQHLLEEIAGLQRRHPDGAPILVDFSDVGTRDYLALFDTADCLVAPSYGEGFLFPAAEAVKRDLDLIVSGWGGQTDFIDADAAQFVAGTFVPARSHVSAPGSLWYEPDRSSLRAAMRSAAATDASRRRDARERTRRRLAEDFTWDRSVERFLQGLEGDRPSTKSFSVVSTWGQTCGIATFTEELLGASSANVSISAIVTERLEDAQLRPTPCPPGAAVCRSWIRDRASLRDAMRSIAEGPTDAVLIEHHPAIFAWDALADAIEILSPTKEVTCELHALTAIEDLRSQMSRVSDSTRFIVHNAKDYRALCKLIDQRQVSLILHGIGSAAVPAPRPARPASSRRIRIGSFGIAAPHKGFDIVVEAAAILHAAGYDVDVQITCYCPEQDRDRRSYVKYLLELAAALRIGDRVSLQLDFQPLGDVLASLSPLDFVLFPYDEVEEGASGALRVGLRSGSCVLVSNAAIFNDVRPYVTTVPSLRAVEYARAMLRIFETQVHREKASAGQSELLEIAAWSHIGRAIFGA